MSILSSISSGLEFWSGNHTSMNEKPESKDLKNIKFVCEISNNRENDLLGKSLYKTLESCW